MSLDAKGRVILERARFPNWRGGCVYSAVTRSLPFIESAFGRYTHRVRSIVVITDAESGKSHSVARCWCGQGVPVHSNSPHRRRFPVGSLLAEPSDRPVCATCEGRAIGSGQLGAREIAGRLVMYSPHRQLEQVA